MSGRGPAPKSNAARRNAGPVALRTITASPTAQPELPDFSVVVKRGRDMEIEPFAWPERTREWWRMWAETPLSSDYTQTDWDFLLDTAFIHARMWQGDVGVAGELRLRVAKFGATPEDRARLRIQFAQADEADERRTKPKGGASRARRGPLTSAG